MNHQQSLKFENKVLFPVSYAKKLILFRFMVFEKKIQSVAIGIRVRVRVQSSGSLENRFEKVSKA